MSLTSSNRGAIARFRHSPDSALVKRSLFLTPYEWLWTAIGAVLAVIGTLFQVSLPASIPLLASYTFTFQLGGLFLTGFMGGARAACLSQAFYVLLGLAGYNVFVNGGGLDYIQRPTFGYLLGFIPGAWICGYWIERVKDLHPRRMATAGLLGLLTVHVVGLSYLLARGMWEIPVAQLALQHSGYVLLGQLVVMTVSIVTALGLRRLMLM